MNPLTQSSVESAAEIAPKVEAFVRNVVVPFEKDPRYTAHGLTVGSRYSRAV